MKIGIGVDTGGTCTDAVAYDFDSKTLLAKGKALTTRENLAIGIGHALDMLPPELIHDAAVVSLSTTLATNACIENKGCRAKLMIFGLTDELLHRLKADQDYGLNIDYVRCVDTHSSADGLKIDEPDWDELFSRYSNWFADADALATAELYAASTGAPCEMKFKTLVQEKLKLECACANDLTDKINVLSRGATALLNARLIPIVQEFVKAAVADFRERQCSAPIMVVRSDGSLMSSALAAIKPVETIISGPAASILAGKTFSDQQDYLVIDMGGTTTDVSVVKNGRPVTADQGIHIGNWRTSVSGVFVDTFALGGDSTIRLNRGALQLSPRRSMPLCIAAIRWPQVKTMLIELLEKRHYNSFPLQEFFYLVREPANLNHYNMYERQLITALKDGPCILELLNERAGIDLYHLDSERLEAEGVVMRCGLTPTDFMHIKGDYLEYDWEAAVLAARYFLQSMQRPESESALTALADEVYELVSGHLYKNIVRILLTQQYPSRFADGLDSKTEFLVSEKWKHRRTNDNIFFEQSIHTSAALIGIGAPTHVFLPTVAETLGTRCILPEHAAVANAMGALKADIDVTVRVEISQMCTPTGATYYIVHTPSGSFKFYTLDEAVKLAMEASENAARKEAVSRGANGQLSVKTYLDHQTAVSNWGTDIHLGYAAVSEVSMGLN